MPPRSRHERLLRFAVQQRKVGTAGDGVADLAVQLQQVVDFATVAARPDDLVAGDVGELGDDEDRLAREHVASRQDIVGAEVGLRIAQAGTAALEGGCRQVGDDLEGRCAPQLADDTLRDQFADRHFLDARVARLEGHDRDGGGHCRRIRRRGPGRPRFSGCAHAIDMERLVEVLEVPLAQVFELAVQAVGQGVTHGARHHRGPRQRKRRDAGRQVDAGAVDVVLAFVDVGGVQPDAQAHRTVCRPRVLDPAMHGQRRSDSIPRAVELGHQAVAQAFHHVPVARGQDGLRDVLDERFPGLYDA